MSDRTGMEVAIIGMAGRFPKAPDLEQLWRNLRDGVEGISFFTDEELAAEGIARELLADPSYVKAGAVLEDVELFDATLFDFPPREAELLDPQQRLLLECAFEALERAGYAGTARSVGVFAGTNRNSYLVNNLAANPEILAAAGGLAVALASDTDFVATRLSYKLNLSGPSLTVQTACSTSLVAVHLACQSLITGECELALAGTATVRSPRKSGHLYQPGAISSPDGHCRAFDLRAEGTVLGQGLGVVVLKLLEDALADGDFIHAVIRGSAINNDGSFKAGFTAPSRDGQAQVIRAAHLRAGVEPDAIGYVEAHGTATPLGDPIEVAALTRAFRLSTQRRQYCALGSVKTNLGHLDAAAGMAGLIKTVLALEHRQIPASLHFATPNPEIDFAASPFLVNARLSEWPARGGPRLAGVSAFGLGGTNAHVVLEEAPPAAPSGPSRPWQTLSLSARSAEALERATDRLATHLAAHPEQNLADVAFTLQVGRKEFSHRRALLANGAADAAAALATRDPRRVWNSEQEAGNRPVAFLLPGLGDQYPGMARELYRSEEVFRREVDRCAELLQPQLGLDLREALWTGAAARDGGSGLDLRAMLGRGDRTAAAETPLDQTRIAQPAVFVVSWALARLWMSWGVQPRVLLGYSLGEYTAACLAGVLTIEDALLLVARRARLIAELPAGAMLAVPLSEEEASAWLADDLSLAAVNGPTVSVLSGPVEAVDKAERRLAATGLPCRRLATTHAFHSAMMAPVRAPLAELVGSLKLAAPRIPYLSNVTGTWITAAEATDPEYWARHLCEPVRFDQAVEAMWAEPERVLLEVGPGQGLSTLALQHPASRGGIAVPSLPHAQDRQPDERFLLGAVSRLWLAGVSVSWDLFYQGQNRRRLPLPTYPFERKRFWIDPPRRDGAAAVPPPPAPLDGAVAAEPPAVAPHGRPKLRNPYVAPTPGPEERLVGLWQSLLGIEPIGIHDNFFEIGGHSLLGTQMMARLRALSGVELPLSALFENPTVADLALQVAKVSATARPPLRPRSAGLRELPLSYAQQRLWFLDQLSPGGFLHNLPSAFLLRGALDPALLTRAFQEIVHRHGTLRTTFAIGDGRPVQKVASETFLEIPFEDLSGLADVESVVKKRLRAEARRPFDLTRGPLLRTVLLRLGAEEHVLVLVFHHIVSDGWSVQLTLSELVAIYTAFATGQPSPLPELAVQYTDYALWQRDWLEGGALVEQLAFWTESLAGAPLALDLPADRPHPPVQTFDGASERFALPAEAAAALSRLALAERASLFMVLLGAFELLLHRHGAQDDLVIGTPIANRTQQETEGLIGLFVNTLALRTDLSGDPTFRGLLARVSRGTIAAYDRQDLPFDRLVEALRPERTLARPPIFQVLFQLLNQPVQPGGASGLAIESLDPQAGIASFELTFSLAETAGGLDGLLEYNIDLFDPSTIQALLSRFTTLLAGIATDPDRRLYELPLLSAPELDQVLHAWNGTAVEVPGAPAHRLFEAQVERTPGAVAAACAGESLTYADLNARANRLAHRLRSLGAGPEALVGIALERSLELLVAVLGVMKAGAAYLPLDPFYPSERLAFMLRDSGARVLLSQNRTTLALPEHTAEVLRLDTMDGSAPDPGNPEGNAGLENLAYVIYTSGSTGRPKGVQVPHRALTNFLWAMCREPGLRPDDVLLAVTSLSFDIAALELYLPLLVGARVEIATGEVAGDGRRLLELLRGSGATALQATPATWTMLLEAEWEKSLRLRLAMTGGEALRGDLAARLHPRAGELWNVYGPTETAVWSTAFRVEAEPAVIVPIGRAVANTRLYVLDRRLAPMPAGAPGELYIGGAGVARGYLGQPELTAERFVPDPWSETGGERLYRTGDLVRSRRDGAFEFIGRVDHQVKIRGFRIESGEIELTLAGHPAVREVVVLARPERSGAQLVAFFVPAGAPPAAAELREHLRLSLPDYMVPAAFVPLSELPLTPNRKVDRAALMRRELDRPAATRDAPFLAPRGPLEEELVSLWARVLGVERVGVQDNFFDIGGHSLRLVEMQAGIRRSLGRDVAIVDLFRHPTITSLAAFLDGGGVPAPRTSTALRSPAGTDIAIIGMEGRFPGAPDLDRFWRNLRDGVESIARLSDEQLLAAGVDPADLESPDLVRAEPLLADIDLFDAAFFGFNPREAQALDPQQRLFLEQSWSCLEGAGYDPARYAGRIAVFAGSGMTAYAVNVFSSVEMCEALDPLSLQTALDKDFLATRVSYKLGLRGPGVSVQTACSTSLVAVHMARQSLLAGECDMALAGGITLKIRQGTGYRYREGAIFSPDGHCRAFDARARGTVFGSGAGVVLLKRLEDALRDGDTIHAVLKGSAINNDGSLKVGYTAPSVAGQAEVVAAAQEAAGVSPESISYVEAHGTATPLGDPVEVAALTQAFRRESSRTGFCALGSVKTNVGHLDTAAGVAGLIKTVLALKHRQIPPSLAFEEPNPRIDFAASPFYVNARLAEWPAGPGPRRAGVSSFGIGGTNAHAVLEEAPSSAALPAGRPRGRQLLPLSARTPAALEEATRNLADFLAAHPETDLDDVAWTLQAGRQEFEHRRMLVCDTIGDAAEALGDLKSSGRVHTRRQEPGRRAVAFLFPGQGAQYPGMGHDLYEDEPVFRAEVDACALRLLPLLGRDLRELLFPPAERREEAARELRQTRFAQPALFAVELALARLWMSWGIRPEAMIGHSLGEYVAACLAGVFAPEDALELVAARGALMQDLPAGAMLSVELSEGELRPELEATPELSLAAVNAPSLCVASGPEAAIAVLEERLAGRGAQVRRLHISHAFHSAMMDPVLAAFAERVARAAPKPPTIPFISNLTGTWITAAQATDPEYWARHLREMVRFAEGLATLLAGSRAALLEIGPGRALGDLARRQADPAVGRPAPVSSMRRPAETESDGAVALGALGRLWLAGVEVDWRGFHRDERRQRVPLPTYPFQRQRFWVDAPRSGSAPAITAEAAGSQETAAAGITETPAALAGAARPDLSTPWQAPRDPLERQLAAIWENLLGIDGIGIHDDFFELGGHSLLATQLVSRLREIFGREVLLESLFAGPTVARLAAHFSAGEPAPPELPAIEPVPRDGPLPLSFAQQRLLFLDMLAPGDTSYNLPLGLRMSGPLEFRRLLGALRRLIDRHEVLRTSFDLVGERPVQVVAAEARIELPLLDLSGLPDWLAEPEAARLAAEEALQPFDLFRGPVLRALLLRLGLAEHALVVDIHHIAVDGWSWGVFYGEMAELYERGEDAALPALRVQYADFAVWQRRWLQGELLDRQLEHWRRRLAGLPPVEIPTDHPRPPARSGRGADLPVSVPGELTAALRKLGRQEDATLFMTLTAAFSLLVSHFTASQGRIVLGTDIANRTRSELEGMMGLFVNQLVLSFDLSGDPTFREILRRVRRETLDAYANQDAPFDKLVEILNPARDMSRTPLFQLKLVLQNTPVEARRLRELSISPFEVPRNTAKFDLLLNLVESGAGIKGSVEYSTDLFEAPTIARLLDGLALVLRTVTERPGARLGEIVAELASQEVRKQEERDRERRTLSLARTRRSVVVTPTAS